MRGGKSAGRGGGGGDKVWGVGASAPGGGGGGGGGWGGGGGGGGNSPWGLGAADPRGCTASGSADFEDADTKGADPGSSALALLLIVYIQDATRLLW